GASRLDHLALADGADLALRLRDDDVRPQIAQHLGMNAVDRQRLLQHLPDAPVDFEAGGVNLEFRLGAGGQAFDGPRKIALMRAPDEGLLEPESADDLGSA